MKIYVTADLHFHHQNMMKFNPDTRPYIDAIHMDESIIQAWNKIVTQEDLTYILGDVAFCGPTRAAGYIDRLNGKKILIAGNHDHKLIKDDIFRRCFKEIHQYLEINVNGTKVCMFHYPVFGHNGCHRGSVMLHGHRHGNPTGITGRIMDVGMDATGSVVSDLATIVKQLETIAPNGHHE